MYPALPCLGIRNIYHQPKKKGNQRESERDRQTERQRDTQSERGGERERKRDLETHRKTDRKGKKEKTFNRKRKRGIKSTLTVLLDMLLHHLSLEDTTQLRQRLQMVDVDDEGTEHVVQCRADPL